MDYCSLATLHATPAASLFWPFYGVPWGFGGLTFGLTMRYLGLSLGMAVALGYCAAGISKEREMLEAMKQVVIKEFRLKKGCW